MDNNYCKTLQQSIREARNKMRKINNGNPNLKTEEMIELSQKIDKLINTYYQECENN